MSRMTEVRTNGEVEIRAVDVRCDDAQHLIAELSDTLRGITGHSAASGFIAEDVLQPRSVFLVAYIGDRPMGCAGLRPMTATIAEIKRVFAYPNHSGVASRLIEALEQYAAGFGYDAVQLETRRTNPHAVDFYLRHGYAICDQYGKYIGRENALCFYKRVRP